MALEIESAFLTNLKLVVLKNRQSVYSGLKYVCIFVFEIIIVRPSNLSHVHQSSLQI